MNENILKSKLSKRIIIIAILVALSLFTVSSVSAVDITLDADYGGGINEAVTNVSNGADSSNTIKLNAGTYNKTTDRNNNINFAKNLTIQGNGPIGSVIIDANEAGRIFYISGNSNITFINITFINGYADYGGAIYNYQGTATIINCTFINNTASRLGGAIGNREATMSVIGSSFTCNAAGENGGGIWNSFAAMTVTGSNFTDNTATNYDWSISGAIDCRDANMTVTGCNFINNKGNQWGNAITIVNYNSPSMTVSINYNRFVNNNSGVAIFIHDNAVGYCDIDYNWWGKNTFDSNRAPKNYYVVNFTNSTSLEDKKVGDEVVFEYTFVLNGTNDNTGVDKLPYFTSILNYNENITLLDARNTTNLPIVLANTNNTFTSITDNVTFSLNSIAFDPKTTLTVSASEIIEGNQTNIQVTLKDAEGKPLSGQTVSITIDGNSYSATTDADGVAVFEISGLTAGTYPIDVSYDGDGTYLASSASGSQVVNAFTSLTVSASEIVEGEKTNIRVTLKDAEGNALAGQTVSITIDGKSYNATTDSEGIAIFKITGLKTGTYSITAFYEGDDTYSSSNDTGTQIVTPYTCNTTLSVSTSAIDEGKKTNIKVTLKDATGKVLSGQTVYIAINKKTYNAITNTKGVAIFKISNLKGGKYTITASYKGDSTYLASTKSATQTVKAKVDLAIVKAKVVKTANKKIMVYKITIQNKGSLKSKSTVLQIQHIRKNGYKSKIKTVKVKALAGGRKTTITVKFYPDRSYHKYCKQQVITVNPKKTMNEITYTNNKKTIKT